MITVFMAFVLFMDIIDLISKGSFSEAFEGLCAVETVHEVVTFLSYLGSVGAVLLGYFTLDWRMEKWEKFSSFEYGNCFVSK